MRGNWLECTTTSGGTGDLVLTASHGFPLLSAPWTGTRQVRYTILEYNSDPSATNANLIRAEDGYCPLNTNAAFGAKILLRSDPTTVVISTWDGAVLLPSEVGLTTPIKLPFGNVSANIRIICSLGAADGPFFTPVVSTNAITGSPYGWGSLVGTPNGTNRQIDINTTGRIAYSLIYWAQFGLYSQMTIRIFSNSAFGVNSSSVQGGIYEISKTGDIGRLIGNFGNLGSLAVSGAFLTGTASTPVFLVPGWYYVAVLPIFVNAGGGNNNYGMVSSGVSPVGNGPTGVTNGGLMTVTGQSVLSDPAVAPTSGSGGGYPDAIWFGLK